MPSPGLAANQLLPLPRGESCPTVTAYLWEDEEEEDEGLGEGVKEGEKGEKE